MHKRIAWAGVLTALLAQPLHAEDAGVHPDVTCLSVISTVIENYQARIKDPAIPAAEKRELEGATNDVMGALAWFMGRVSMLPPEARTIKLIGEETGKAAALPEDSFGDAANSCLGQFADGKAATRNKMWFPQ